MSSNKTHIEINNIRKMVEKEYKLQNLLAVDDFLKEHNIVYFTPKGKVRQHSEIKKEINNKIEERKLKKYYETTLKDNKDKLCLDIGNFVTKNNATIKQVCEYFDITKDKYYKYKSKLEEIDKDLYDKVQMVAKSNQTNTMALPTKEIIKKKNDEIIIESLDKKVEILKPAFEIIFELVKNNSDYRFLIENCIKKMDTEKDGEIHKIENEYDDDFDCCQTVNRQYDLQTKRRVFKDFDKILDVIRLLDLGSIQKTDKYLKDYRNEEREYITYDEKLRNLNDNINKTREKLGIVEE